MTTGLSVNVANIQPYSIYGIPVVIPPGQSFVVQYFNGLSIALDPNEFNYIPYVSCRVDTSGIYNMPTSETFQLNGAPVVVAPGNYTLAQINTITNTTTPTSGANAFKTTNAQTLQFIQNSSLAIILGYQSFGTALIPAATLSTTTVNETANNDTILVSCDLIGESNSLGANYLGVFNLSGNTSGTIFFDRVFINPPTPIVKTNFNSVRWTVQKFDGTPFICDAPIQIFYRFGSQKKSLI
jgi:hypothetical protein